MLADAGSQRSSDRTRVVVVGAGLAGLSAAWRLHEQDVDVVVLEARDRVGGRTWSARLENDVVVERGGEFIGPEDHCLRGLCSELGLDLVPHGFSFDTRAAPGVAPPSRDQIDSLAASARAYLEDFDSDQPAASALPPLPERTAAHESIIRRIETSLTIPLSEVSARRIFAGGSDHYDPAVRVRGGNDSVSRELARLLGDRVRLRSAVVAVRHAAEGAAVHIESGESIQAAVVVLALPLPLLLELDLEPGLPVPVRDAARRIRFGDAAKLHVPLTPPARVGGIASPDARWWCWVSRAADGTGGAAALSAFAGGAEAIRALLRPDASPRRWRDAALALRPDLVADGAAHVTHWGTERWTQGSYSAPGIGASVTDDAEWARRWGALVFAGEHTAGPHAGTMNGATLSGSRAATRVTEFFERVPTA